ncbi:dihydrodipicolinate synthase family protein [Tabrizicola sp.]|uniref:dihydrodipicolinate synthase family protein n=1 Tax=Tabrizicola sp. TaxID=2005166 RepID=UPI003F401963
MVGPQRFPGIHCVLYALFDADERLDRAAMAAQVAYVRALRPDGITVLGLATEVGKLSFEERSDLIRWTRTDAPDLPLSVTIAGNSVAEQQALIGVAEAAGADWLILQPPVAGSYGAAEYIDFFALVGATTRLPFAIQNAPQYLGRSLSDDDIVALRARCPGFAQIKSETGAVDLDALVRRVGPDMTVLNGRGGLEMTDCLRAGVEGFIVAPDVLPGVLRCWRAWSAGDLAGAEAAYADFLPAALFGMQSLEHLICYGKRIFGRRAGIPIHDRAPAMRPTAFGLSLVRHWAAKAPARV